MTFVLNHHDIKNVKKGALGILRIHVSKACFGTFLGTGYNLLDSSVIIYIINVNDRTIIRVSGGYLTHHLQC